jgi:hypothetical protein
MKIIAAKSADKLHYPFINDVRVDLISAVLTTFILFYQGKEQWCITQNF